MDETRADKQPLTINGQSIQLEDYGSLNNNEFGAQEAGPPLIVERSCYFRDGKTRIDFVLVYEQTAEHAQIEKELKDSKRKGEKKGKKTAQEKAIIWRKKFLRHLKDANLLSEEEKIQGKDRVAVYLKLSAPWDVLCRFAEELNMRTPLQSTSDAFDDEASPSGDDQDTKSFFPLISELSKFDQETHPNPSENWSDKWLRRLGIPNIMYHDVPNKPPDYYTAPFRVDKLDRFIGHEDHDTFFKTTQRQRVLWEILATTPFGKKQKAEIGIERLLEEGVFTAAYPLHDGPYELPSAPIAPEKLNSRQVLYQYWARWGVWYKYQPLDHIRDYFGEKVGIYFAWLGFYTAWLLPAALVGFLVFVYGCATVLSAKYSTEICQSGDMYRMCPLYSGANYWYMSKACMYAKLAWVCDNPGTVFFAVFVALWAVFKLEFWKRKNASLAHHWDVMNYEEEEERPRPQYAAMAPAMERNPVTGQMEPHFPDKQRLPRIASGLFMVITMQWVKLLLGSSLFSHITMMLVVIIFILAVIIYRTLISTLMYKVSSLEDYATLVGSATAAVLNLIIIIILGSLYQKMAYKMTVWEMHRTQTEFEDQYIFKVFVFQFLNFYSSVIYIAFIKGKFVGYPGHYTKIFGIRLEECQAGGCMAELAIQLAVIMVGKQMINNCQELLIPKVMILVRYLTAGDFSIEGFQRLVVKGDEPQYIEDMQENPHPGLFEEYLEMAIQFGFITIFVAAFPLAPLFALLNNWMEIRLDAHKFVCETRRPVAERAQDIGTWFTILDVLAQLAVISNAFLIAFTSEFIPEMLYRYWYIWDLSGYLKFTLSVATPNMTGENLTCTYQDWRDMEGNYTMFFYKLLAVRLAFVIVFEHVVFFIQRMIDLMVPDIPESLQIKIQREAYLAKQALTEIDAGKKPVQSEDDLDDDTAPV